MRVNMLWLSRQPDLKPTEHLWQNMDQCVRRSSIIKTPKEGMSFWGTRAPETCRMCIHCNSLRNCIVLLSRLNFFFFFLKIRGHCVKYPWRFCLATACHLYLYYRHRQDNMEFWLPPVTISVKPQWRCSPLWFISCCSVWGLRPQWLLQS